MRKLLSPINLLLLIILSTACVRQKISISPPTLTVSPPSSTLEVPGSYPQPAITCNPASDNTGYPVGSEAIIPLPESVFQIRSISFISMQEGWGIIDSRLCHTRDGGLTWEEVVVPSVKFGQIDFVDQTHGWALGSDGLYATQDGGRYWQKLVEAPSGWRPKMDYVTADNGWLAKKDELFSTRDGGVTWQKAVAPRQPEPSIQKPTPLPTATIDGVFVSEITSIFFISPNTGWVLYERFNPPANSGALFRTSNGGASWDRIAQLGMGAKVFTLPHIDSMNEVYFLDELHGWFVGSRGEVSVSNDGGKSWARVNSNLPGIDTALRQIKIFDDQQGIALIEARSTIVKTEDGGKTWHPVSLGQIRKAQ